MSDCFLVLFRNKLLQNDEKTICFQEMTDLNDSYLHTAFHKIQSGSHTCTQSFHLYMFLHSDSKQNYTRW